mmetsp:Transcript_60943/g.145146  ORF Transcript_60943/g.145146 Transcript_60943/m.145146 type:complete len:215 (+) Transcript_60943:193-837(+)
MSRLGTTGGEKYWTMRRPLRPMIRIVHSHANTWIAGGVAKSPMTCLLEVKRTRGTSANGSWNDSTTWESIRSWLMALSPDTMTTTTAGTTASARVTNRRGPGESFRSMNPSHMTCPASVPVTVDCWPEARSATPKRTEAALLPRRVSSIALASSRSAIPVWPVLWNVAAATMRMAELTKNARNSERTRSIVENLIASFTAASVRSMSRDCTRLE